MERENPLSAKVYDASQVQSINQQLLDLVFWKLIIQNLSYAKAQILQNSSSHL